MNNKVPVLVGLLASMLLAGCTRSQSPYNPQRSAELLRQSQTYTNQALQEIGEVRAELDVLRAATRNVGKFPWEDWRVEPKTRILVTSPAGKEFEFTVHAPITNFVAWDEIGNDMIQLSRENPTIRHFKIKLSKSDRTAKETVDNQGIPTRLRPSISALSSKIDNLEQKLRNAQRFSERAGDLLPGSKQ